MKFRCVMFILFPDSKHKRPHAVFKHKITVFHVAFF
jgi:hypothetical protein